MVWQSKNSAAWEVKKSRGNDHFRSKDGWEWGAYGRWGMESIPGNTLRDTDDKRYKSDGITNWRAIHQGFSRNNFLFEDMRGSLSVNPFLRKLIGASSND